MIFPIGLLSVIQNRNVLVQSINCSNHEPSQPQSSPDFLSGPLLGYPDFTILEEAIVVVGDPCGASLVAPLYSTTSNA